MFASSQILPINPSVSKNEQNSVLKKNNLANPSSLLKINCTNQSINNQNVATITNNMPLNINEISTQSNSSNLNANTCSNQNLPNTSNSTSINASDQKISNTTSLCNPSIDCHKNVLNINKSSPVFVKESSEIVINEMHDNVLPQLKKIITNNQISVTVINKNISNTVDDSFNSTTSNSLVSKTIQVSSTNSATSSSSRKQSCPKKLIIKDPVINFTHINNAHTKINARSIVCGISNVQKNNLTDKRTYDFELEKKSVSKILIPKHVEAMLYPNVPDFRVLQTFNHYWSATIPNCAICSAFGLQQHKGSKLMSANWQNYGPTVLPETSAIWVIY